MLDAGGAPASVRFVRYSARWAAARARESVVLFLLSPQAVAQYLSCHTTVVGARSYTSRNIDEQ